MKRNTLFSISAAAMLLFTYGCSLDEYNPSGMSTGQEWSTPEGFEKKVNDCYYDMIRIVYGQAEDTYMMASEGGTDIWQDANAGGSNGNWSNVLRYSGSFSGMMGEGYKGFYGTLSACNAAIYYADKVEGLSQDRINELVAEAHFIRAHALYNIVENWGGKYLPLEPSTTTVSVLPCSTVNDFYKTIIADLEFAKTHLPLSQSVRGHVTRGAAYHLYAKACLTYATYTDGLGNATAISAEESKNYLTLAKAAADELIDHATTYGVKLYEDVDDVFDEYKNKTNEEALFVVCHSTVTAYNPRGNYFNRAWKHSEAYSNSTDGIYLGGLTASYETVVKGVTVPKVAKGNCYMEPSKYMLDLYGAKDKRYKAFFKDTYYVNNPTNTAGNGYTWEEADATRYGLSKSRVGNTQYDIMLGDTAVFISRNKTYTQAEKEACRYAIYNVEDNYANPAKPLKFFPSLKKMDCPSLYAGSNAGKPYSSADCIVYRLGETYLLSAEIDWRLGDNEGAAKRLTKLRERACVGNDGSLDVTKDMVTEKFLLDEYAREMIGEWGRWMTLKRFRALESRIQLANPQITSFNKNVHYLRPIPDEELLLLDNAAEYQNPGY